MDSPLGDLYLPQHHAMDSLASRCLLRSHLPACSGAALALDKPEDD